MYNILLIDDERPIREGILKSIDWPALNYVPYSAENGKEGMEIIQNYPIDIVITDIKMPVISGLELIRQSSQIHPNLKYAILSGYDDFTFAHEAMQYGVRHYILKPTKSLQIVETIQQLQSEIDLQRQKDLNMNHLREQINLITPLVKEQYLRDLIMHRRYQTQAAQTMKDIIGMDESCPCSVILFDIGRHNSFEARVRFKEDLDSLVQSDPQLFLNEVFLSTIIEDNIFFLTSPTTTESLVAFVQTIQNQKDDHISVAIAQQATSEQLPEVFDMLRKQLRSRSLLDNECIITPDHVIVPGNNCAGDALPNVYDSLAKAVQDCDGTLAVELLQSFFEKWSKVGYSGHNIRLNTLEMLLFVVHRTGYNRIDLSFLTAVTDGEEDESVSMLYKKISEVILHMADSGMEKDLNKYSYNIRKLLQYIEQNYDNDNLSMSWLAQNVLYMNEDYLGKLFKKETGKNFNPYLMELRMERAKELLEGDGDIRTIDVARAVGMQKNPQYFSNLFKKYTGMTTTEYKHHWESLHISETG